MHLRFPARTGLLAFLLVLCFSFRALAQKDKIEGFWMSEGGDAKIEIYKAVDGKFWGKIVWLKNPLRDGQPKLDIHNTNERLRNRPIMGMPILQHFVVDDEDTYNDGEIYDPKNGKTYSCKITYKNANELSVRGYIGVSLIGRTTTLTRATN